MVFLRQQICIACFFFRSEDSKTVCKHQMVPQFGHSYWHMSHVHQSNRFEWNEHNPKPPVVQKARHTKGTPPTCPKVVVGSVLESALLQLDLPTQSLHLRFSQLVVLIFGLRIHLFHVSQFPLLFSRQTWRPFSKSHWSPIWIKFVAPLKTIWPNSLAGTMLDQAGVSLHAKSCTIGLVFLCNILLSIANVGQQTAL